MSAPLWIGVKYWVTDNGDRPPSALARVKDSRWVERITSGDEHWEPYPRLHQKLVIDSLQMSWDEISISKARAALVVMRVDPAVLGEPFIHERPGAGPI